VVPQEFDSARDVLRLWPDTSDTD